MKTGIVSVSDVQMNDVFHEIFILRIISNAEAIETKGDLSRGDVAAKNVCS